MHKPAILATLATVLLPVVAAHAQLQVTEMNGTLFPGNYSTLPTSTAFGKDEIGGGSLPQHKIPNIRDGIYGNSNSWIGDSTDSFVGVSFGGTPVPVAQFAFGRDNTGQFSDRSAGTFTLQYTTTANPDATTPDAQWVTIGSITQSQNDAGVYSSAKRHAFSFPSVNATGMRVITPGSSFASGADIDELEFTSVFARPAITLALVGGEMNPTTNIALDSNGGVAFAKDVLQGFPAHSIPHLNDGITGNPNSWIGDTEDSFAGVKFALPQQVNRIAFGRDNTGQFLDRADGYYLVQYTKDLNPDASTPDTDWLTIGPVFIDAAAADRELRHEYTFDPVAGATALRLIAPGNGIGSGRAIDELEVYAIPEPGSALLLVAGGALAGLRRRRR
jgi:hypothetical protein